MPRELATSLFGASELEKGTIGTKRGPLNLKDIRTVMRSGIAMIPRNRKERGILPDLNIRSNNSLAFLVAKHRSVLVNQKTEHARFEKSRERLDIRVSSDLNLITSLSGGNQQKVILARWLLTDPKYLILDEPTRGIDVGTKVEIQKLVIKLADGGMSLTFISSEIGEMLRTCSRLIVMKDREIVGELRGTDLTENDVMNVIAQGRKNVCAH